MAVPSSSPMRSESSAEETEAVVAAVDKGEIQRKRKNDPGVRVVGGRIYCSVNGKTCHQCRQKTLDFAAVCKNMKGLKQCTIKFCQKCLKNRYGEKASEVAKCDEWHCPKCRGICNCSFCMKKRGQQPTGILVHAAKRTGFSSVSEMLKLGSPSKVIQDVDQSPNKPCASIKLAVLSPSKQGKENSFDKDVDTKSSTVKCPEKSAKKRKSGGLKEICNGSEADADFVEDKPLKSVGELEAPEQDEQGLKAITKRKLHVLKDDCTKEEEKPVVTTDGGCTKGAWASDAVREVDGKILAASVPKNCDRNLHRKELPAEVPLPSGTLLTTVAGVDLPVEAVGEALQFLEFCAAFGKVLDLRKGQAESLLRELVSNRRRRTGQASVVVRFHVQLLSFIEENFGEESSPSSSTNEKISWLKALEEFAAKSQSSLREFTPCFDGGADGYNNLDISKKLRLLNFLCDEVLSAEPFRIWIEEQNTKYNEDGKEAKEKLLAAKTKEKLLKQKLQNELAEAIIAKNGVPLTIPEHEAIVSQVKDELAQARADVVRGKTSNKRQRCDAVRTDPLFLDFNGHAFWKLKASGGESDILLQELGNGDLVGSGEKWFIYEPEKKHAVDTYISTTARRHNSSKSSFF